MTPEQMSRITGQMNAAFAGEEGWPETLTAVSDFAGARGAFLIPVSPDNRDRLVSPSLEECHAEYRRYWHRHDFRFGVLGKIMRTGVGVDQDIVSADRMAKMPFYDYLGAFRLRWFAGIPFTDGVESFLLTFQRTPEEGPFEATEQDRLRLLGAALSQSVSLACRLAGSHATGMLEGLALGGSMAVLLDRQGRVVETSGNIPELVRNDLRAGEGQLMLGTSPLRALLMDRMQAVMHPPERIDDPVLLPLSVPRPDRRPILLRLRALTREHSRFYHKAVVVVLVNDPDRTASLPHDLLCRAFGLTKGQARIAASVGTGQSVKGCAEELGISPETVRTTLQKVFHKVGVSRQSELVRILVPYLRS